MFLHVVIDSNGNISPATLGTEMQEIEDPLNFHFNEERNIGASICGTIILSDRDRGIYAACNANYGNKCHIVHAHQVLKNEKIVR